MHQFDALATTARRAPARSARGNEAQAIIEQGEPILDLRHGKRRAEAQRAVRARWRESLEPLVLQRIAAATGLPSSVQARLTAYAAPTAATRRAPRSRPGRPPRRGTRRSSLRAPGAPLSRPASRGRRRIPRRSEARVYSSSAHGVPPQASRPSRPQAPVGAGKLGLRAGRPASARPMSACVKPRRRAADGTCQCRQRHQRARGRRRTAPRTVALRRQAIGAAGLCRALEPACRVIAGT
jgi:hypothetical protein